MNYGGNQKPHLLMLLNNREKKFNYIKYIHIDLLQICLVSLQ